MELSESEVSGAVDSLRERRPGARVQRQTRAYEFTHNAQRGVGVPEQSCCACWAC